LVCLVNIHIQVTFKTSSYQLHSKENRLLKQNCFIVLLTMKVFLVLVILATASSVHALTVTSANLRGYTEGHGATQVFHQILNDLCGGLTIVTGTLATEKVSATDPKAAAFESARKHLSVLDVFIPGTTIDFNLGGSGNEVLTDDLIKARFNYDLVLANEASVLRNAEVIETRNEVFSEPTQEVITIMLPSADETISVTTAKLAHPKSEEGCLLEEKMLTNCNYQRLMMFRNIYTNIFTLYTHYKTLTHSLSTGPLGKYINETYVAFENILGVYAAGKFIVTFDVAAEAQIARYHLYDLLHIVTVYLDAFFELIEEGIEHLHQKGIDDYSFMDVTLSADKKMVTWRLQLNGTGDTDLAQDLGRFAQLPPDVLFIVTALKPSNAREEHGKHKTSVEKHVAHVATHHGDQTAHGSHKGTKQ